MQNKPYRRRNNMKYNNDYHSHIDKPVDTQSFWQFRRDYLDGLSAQKWCEYGLELSRKVNRKMDFE